MFKISLITSIVISTLLFLMGLFIEFKETSLVGAKIDKCFSSIGFLNAEEYKKKEYGNFFIATDSSCNDIMLLAENKKFIYKNNLFEKIYNQRLKDYKENSQALSTLIQFLAAFIIIGLLILFYKPTSLTIPILGIDLPDSLLYPSVTIGLVYLWLQFGLSLNSGIDSRLALHHMVELQETVGKFKVANVYSSVNALVDKSILDTWSSIYYGTIKDGKTDNILNFLTLIGLFGVFGTFWGIIHGTCLLLLIEFYKIKPHRLKRVLYGFCFTLFIFSDAAFVIEFMHASFLIAWVWCVVVIMLVWWEKMGRFTAIKISEKSK